MMKPKSVRQIRQVESALEFMTHNPDTERTWRAVKRLASRLAKLAGEREQWHWEKRLKRKHAGKNAGKKNS